MVSLLQLPSSKLKNPSIYFKLLQNYLKLLKTVSFVSYHFHMHLKGSKAEKSNHLFS